MKIVIFTTNRDVFNNFHEKIYMILVSKFKKRLVIKIIEEMVTVNYLNCLTFFLVIDESCHVLFGCLE